MFEFNFIKTVQAAAHLLSLERCHQMNYMRLLKFLYIADRESLKEIGAPITCDKVVAMKRGPVLSRVYDLILGRDILSRKWSDFFQREDYWLILEKNPGNGKLCVNEIDILNKVFETFKSYDEFRMVDFTHQFKEWKKAYSSLSGDQKAEPIPTKSILKALGMDHNRIKEIEDRARLDAAISHLFTPSEA